MPNFAAVSEWFLRRLHLGRPMQDCEKQGQIPEWPNGADCKSAGLRLRWFESIFAHLFENVAEIAQLIEH